MWESQEIEKNQQMAFTQSLSVLSNNPNILTNYLICTLDWERYENNNKHQSDNLGGTKESPLNHFPKYSVQQPAFIIVKGSLTQQGIPKKCPKRTKSSPKLSAVGLNCTMDMTWGRLILLSLNKKRQKKHFPGPSGANHCTMQQGLPFEITKFWTLKIDFSANFHLTHDYLVAEALSTPQNWKTLKGTYKYQFKGV